MDDFEKSLVDGVTVEEAANEAAEHMRQFITEFISTIRAGFNDSQKPMTIDELERNWDILDVKTKKLYADLVSSELSSIDEKPFIESKKENSQRKG